MSSRAAASPRASPIARGAGVRIPPSRWNGRRQPPRVGWAARRSGEEGRMAVKLNVFSVEENPRSCEAGEVIFEEYDMGSEMYVVLEGEVDLRIRDKVVETLGPGEP